MKKELQNRLLEFMKSTDTSEMSSNSFIEKFLYWEDQTIDPDRFLSLFATGPSVESISRARRKIIADHGIGKRTKADTEKEYIEEFARSNKF